jgi:hypothetical protein
LPTDRPTTAWPRTTTTEEPTTTEREQETLPTDEVTPAETGVDEHPVPTTSSGQTIVVVGPDSEPLEKNREGQYLGPDGSPVSFKSN